jgi:hypothetical protein
MLHPSSGNTQQLRILAVISFDEFSAERFARLEHVPAKHALGVFRPYWITE